MLISKHWYRHALREYHRNLESLMTFAESLRGNSDTRANIAPHLEAIEEELHEDHNRTISRELLRRKEQNQEDDDIPF